MRKNNVHWRYFALLICIFISYLSPPAMAQTSDCIYLNPQGLDPADGINNYLYITYGTSGIPTYTMPPATAENNSSCLTFCLQDCEIIGTTIGTIDGNVGAFIASHHFTISGPGYSFDETMFPVGGPYCFTLPGTGLYTITVTDIATSTSFNTSINVVASAPTPDPMSVTLSPNKVCTCEEIAAQFPAAIDNHNNYFAVHWQIDGGTNEYKNPDCGVTGTGIHSLGVTGLDGCGNPHYGSEIFTILPPDVTFETIQVNCYDVDVNPLYQCIDPSTVSGYNWNFGDGSTSTAANPGVHHYTGPGTYHITMTCTDGTNTYFFETDVVVSTASPLTISGPTVACGSPLTYIISGGTVDSTYSITPSSAATIAYSGTPNQYTVTVLNTSVPFTITFNYTDNNGCEGVSSINIKECCSDANTPLVISGPNYTCSLNGLYGTTAATGGSVIYNWSIAPSTAGTITAGAGTQNVTITWANQFTPAMVTVTATNENGCIQTGTFMVNACCLSEQTVPTGALSTSPAGPTNLTAYLGVWPGVPVGATSISGKSIYVFENLTINTNFTFDNCNIFVAPGKSITVNAGITVDWVDGQVREMCNEMWAGIFASSATTKITGNRTTFRAAVHAMNSYNGADIDLTACTFLNDYTGLTIKNYILGPHPVSVTRCTFMTSTVLIPPYAGRQTHKGIDVENVSDLTIGNSGSAANINTFLKADYGIHIFDSNVKTFNGSYTKIQPTASSVYSYCCGCELGTGICDVNTKKNAVYTLTAGQSAALENKFDQCNSGIFTVGKIHEKIHYNNMNNVVTGVNIFDNGGTNIDLSPNNFIKNYTLGIFIYNIPNANLNISQCYLNTTVGGPVTTTVNGQFGITVNNPVSLYYKALIKDNGIDKTNNGIYILNSLGVPGISGPSQIDINTNTIQYSHYGVPPTTWTTEQNGIRIENSSAILVRFNTITRPNYGTNLIGAGAVGYFRGIKINNSPIVGVLKNTVNGFGEGVRTYGNCNNTLYACNNVAFNYNAFNFEGPSGTAAINTYQINSAGLPQGNYYGPAHSVSGFDLEGGLFPAVRWYYNGGSSYNAITGLITNSTTYGPPNFNEDEPTTHLNSETCGGVVPYPTEDREAMIGGMEGTVTYNEDNEAFTQFDRLHAYRLLKQHPEWLSLGTPQDAIYQDFYNASLANGTSKFDSVATSIERDSLNAARMVNNSIATTNTSDYNLRRVNELYLSSLDSALTPADSLELVEIAYQNGTIGGPGVYHARAIMRLYLDELNGGEVRTLQMGAEQEQAPVAAGFVVYPNPNTGQFYLKLDNANIDHAYTVEITDMQGKLIFGESFVYKGQAKTLNLTAENGVYVLILKDVNQQVVKHERVIISK